MDGGGRGLGISSVEDKKNTRGGRFHRGSRVEQGWNISGRLGQAHRPVRIAAAVVHLSTVGIPRQEAATYSIPGIPYLIGNHHFSFTIFPKDLAPGDPRHIYE